ncbi:MAG: MMPL family transporter [Spirochaetota bacterium]|nr:MMPL family transporter [Spirochaetota bacterium]
MKKDFIKNGPLYIPFESKGLVSLLKRELVLLTSGISLLLIAFIVEQLVSGLDIIKWFNFFGFSFVKSHGDFLLFVIGFIFLPLALFFINHRLIYLIENSFSNSLKWFKIHLYTGFTISLLLILYLAISPFNHIFIRFAQIIICVILITMNIIKFLYLRKSKRITILWNNPAKTDFKKYRSLDFIIQSNVRNIIKYTFFFILFFLHITVLFSWMASQLKLNADLIALLPEDFPSVRGLKDIQEVFGGSGYLMLAIETNEAEEELKIFEKENNVKINYDYIRGKDGKPNKYLRINEEQKVIVDEPVIKEMYYYKDGNSNIQKNANGRLKKKIRWEAKLTRTKEFIEDLTNKISKLSEVSYCDYKRPIDYFKRKIVLYIDIGDLSLINIRAKRKKRELFKEKVGWSMDLSDKSKSDASIKMDDIEKKYKNSSSENYYLSKDGFYLSGNKLFVVLIKPEKASLDIDFCNLLYGNVKKIVDSTKAEFEKKLKKDAPIIKIGYGGRYKRKPETTNRVEKDIDLTSFIGFLFIIGVIVLYFRRIQAILLIGLPLIIGLIWTFGITYLRFGHVNILTGFLSVILMGLGVDFGIHFLSRYFEERGKGESIDSSLGLMLSKTGKATLTAAFTTISAFFALLFTDFKGFNEFGFIGMIGLVMAYLSMFYVLTSFIVIYDKEKWLKNRISLLLENKLAKIIAYIVLGIAVIISLYFTFNGSRYFILLPYLVFLKGIIFVIDRIKKLFYRYNFLDVIFRKPRMILGITLGIIVLSIVASSQVYFEYNFRKLEGMKLYSYLVEDKISDLFDLSLTPSIVIAYDEEDEKEIYDSFSRIKENKDKLEEKSTIFYVDALTRYVPDYQTEKMEMVKEFKKFIDEFVDLAEAKKYKGNADIEKHKKKLLDLKNEYLDNVDIIRKDPDYPDPDEAMPIEIWRQFRNPKNKKDVRSFIQIFPTKNLGEDGQKIKTFASEIRGIRLKNRWVTVDKYVQLNKITKEEVLKSIEQKKLKSKKEKNGNLLVLLERKEVSASGENLVLADVLIQVEKSAPIILIITFGLTIFFLYFDFRNLKAVLITFTPLLLGVALLFGLMFLFDVQFNILNVVILPVIVGIGIDNGVHLYHRYQDEGEGNLFAVLRSTGLAITFASLTTILGFGALILADHNGLNSIGWLAVLGIGATYIIAVIVLPSIILLLEKKKNPKKTFSTNVIKKKLFDN